MRRLPIVPVAVLALATAAQAAPTPPADLQPAPALTPRPDEIVAGVPITNYVLSLSWTPEWCRSGGSGASAKQMECAQALGFTLHGLWPDGARPPYPAFCKPVGSLDISTVREMWKRTPSAVLLQHEWQKHGPCGPWADPKAFFAQEARLYDRVVMPKIEAIAPSDLTAGAVRAAFVAKNPWLKPDQLFVSSLRNREDALSEVRICLDLAFKAHACPGGNGAPDGAHLTLAPSNTRSF